MYIYIYIKYHIWRLTEEADGYSKMPSEGNVARLFHYFEVIRIRDRKEGRRKHRKGINEERCWGKIRGKENLKI